MWTRPWNMKEGFTLGAGLLFSGILLQLSCGPVDWSLLCWPKNLISILIFAAVMVTVFILRRKYYILRRIATASCAVPAIVYAVLLTVVMGLLRQAPSTRDATDPIGLTKMLSFWPFILTYLWMTVVLSQVTIRQILHPSWRRMPSLLSHAGLLIILTCATVGSGDIQRLKMICEQGQPEWRAVDNKENVVELPIAIQLNKFILEEYEPELIEADDSTRFYSPRRDPKRFASEVQLLTQSGKNIVTTIEVNKPFEIEGWKIYQYGYDQQAGAMSTMSIFELVTDPWQTAVYIGIYLLLSGAVLMFITMRKRKEASV